MSIQTVPVMANFNNGEISTISRTVNGGTRINQVGPSFYLWKLQFVKKVKLKLCYSTKIWEFFKNAHLKEIIVKKVKLRVTLLQDLHIAMDGQQYQQQHQQYFYRPPSILSQDQVSPDSQIAPTPPGHPHPPPTEMSKQASSFSSFFQRRKYFSILFSESQQLFLNID